VDGLPAEEDEPSFTPPPQAVNKSAVAALRAKASVVFLGESISSPVFD
jgi:hypothetical protein